MAAAALLTCLIAGSSPAQTVPGPPPPVRTSGVPETLATPKKRAATLAEALDTPGDLSLRKSTLSGALFTIGELWGINIVSGKIDGNVNGVFKQAPLREILDSILLSNGYGYRAVGESLVVTDLSRLGQINPFFQSATIPVRAADINDVVAGAELLTTPQGRVQGIPSARSLFVLDFPDRVKMIHDFVASLDAAASGTTPGGASGAAGAMPVGPRQLEVAYVKAHYVAAERLSEALSTVLSPLGRVTAMQGEDRLLIVDYPENIATAQRVLERIDRPRPQVSIKSLIYDLSLTDIEQIGVNWSSITNGTLADLTVGAGGSLTSTNAVGSGVGTVISSATSTPFAGGSPGGAFTFTSLSSSISLATVALLLQQADDSRLLASPAVTVAENQRAVIESVTEIPFQQLQQTAAGGSIGTTAFKEAGVTLAVTPKIARDLTVEMVVRPEFSLLTGFTPGENQPIIDRRTAETTVRIANGSTLVIGGMRQRSDVGSVAGIPFLKDIRGLGHLFRSRQTNIRESELVVFITPTIVGYDTPPSERDQRAVETLRCQLASIPPATGCPAGDGWGATGDGRCVAACGEGARPASARVAPPAPAPRPADQPANPPGPLPLSAPLSLPPTQTAPLPPAPYAVRGPRSRTAERTVATEAGVTRWGGTKRPGQSVAADQAAVGDRRVTPTPEPLVTASKPAARRPARAALRPRRLPTLSTPAPTTAVDRLEYPDGGVGPRYRR